MATLAAALLAADNAPDLDPTSMRYPVWQASVRPGLRGRCGGPIFSGRHYSLFHIEDNKVPMSQPLLFQPITLRGVTAKNRILISPMCQYSAIDGLANDWHLVHLGKFAQGGAGMVMVEAAAVTAEGRITHGDVGLWHDGQIAPLQRIAAFVRDNGAVPAIQLAHAGRKGSMQRPWFGNAALNADDRARGDLPWRTVAPSAIAMDEGWLTPDELDLDELESLREHWHLATLRAVDAGFEFLEVHCAHGYLLHAFLSPLSNRRGDDYGGDRAGRMRYPLEIIETVRAAWPADRPLSVRISSVDGVEGGLDLADQVAFAREAKARGADRLFLGRIAGLGDSGADSARLWFSGPLCE
jgi:2,4-dienoyl-CoA reductase-like NADH-dependent reductase (Old Yellow Enzyme family)